MNYKGFLLPDQDSNLDTQSQSLMYYHYTIGQYMAFKNSDPGGIRTLGPLIKSQLLYQLSYGVFFFYRGANIQIILSFPTHPLHCFFSFFHPLSKCFPFAKYLLQVG